MNQPFSTISVGVKIPLKAALVLLWSKVEEEVWKLGTFFDTLFSTTLDFSEKSSIFCLKFEDSDESLEMLLL